jgi:hypothetical protein
MRVAVSTVMALALASCATSRGARSGAQITTAYRFECAPQDATLIVDEQNQGQCVLWQRRALGLGPGAHRLRVEREGFLPYESEISGQGPRGTIRVELRQRPE